MKTFTTWTQKRQALIAGLIDDAITGLGMQNFLQIIDYIDHRLAYAYGIDRLEGVELDQVSAACPLPEVDETDLDSFLSTDWN